MLTQSYIISPVIFIISVLLLLLSVSVKRAPQLWQLWTTRGRLYLWLSLSVFSVLATSCGGRGEESLNEAEQPEQPQPTPIPDIPPPEEEEPIEEEPSVVTMPGPVQQMGKGGIIQDGKGGVLQGVIQGKGGIVQDGKGGITQIGVGQGGKGGVGIGQGKGGIIQDGKGGIAQIGVGQGGKGGVGIGQGKGGIVQDGKGGIAQIGVGQGGKAGIDQGKAGIGQGGKTRIHQGKSLGLTHQTNLNAIGPYAAGVVFQAVSNTHGYEDLVPGESACASKQNHHITHETRPYILERYVTSIYANSVTHQNGDVSLTDFTTVIEGQLVDIDTKTLGTIVVHEGKLYAEDSLSYGQNGLIISSASDMPVATINLGNYAFSKEQADVGQRTVELNFDDLGACLGLYKHASGAYLGNKHLVLVLP